MYKRYKRLVYSPPDLLARFCKINLSNAKNSNFEISKRIFYCLPLTKIMTRQNLLCLWSKIILKASSVHHKFFSFKKRPNINLYVEYSRTLIRFFQNSKFAYKTTKFYSKWTVLNFGQKSTPFNILKLCKVGISNSVCNGTV